MLSFMPLYAKIVLVVIYFLGGNMVLLLALRIKEIEDAFKKYGANPILRLIIVVLFLTFYPLISYAVIIVRGLKALFGFYRELICGEPQKKNT